MTTILAIIDGGREPAYRRSWPVALRLAERQGATLLLADRFAMAPEVPVLEVAGGGGLALLG
jgi:hypothetical protein